MIRVSDHRNNITCTIGIFRIFYFYDEILLFYFHCLNILYEGTGTPFSYFYEYCLNIFHILLRFSVSDRLRSTPSGQVLRPFYFLCESHMTLPGTSQGVYGLFYFQRGKVEHGKQCMPRYILCVAGSDLLLLK